MQFERFENLFDAIADTLSESADMEARFGMLCSLETQIRSWGVSRNAAATRIGIGRVQLSDILRGKLSEFSHDRLISLIVATASTPEVRIEETE